MNFGESATIDWLLLNQTEMLHLLKLMELCIKWCPRVKGLDKFMRWSSMLCLANQWPYCVLKPVCCLVQWFTIHRRHRSIVRIQSNEDAVDRLLRATVPRNIAQSMRTFKGSGNSVLYTEFRRDLARARIAWVARDRSSPLNGNLTDHVPAWTKGLQHFSRRLTWKTPAYIPTSRCLTFRQSSSSLSLRSLL